MGQRNREITYLTLPTETTTHFVLNDFISGSISSINSQQERRQVEEVLGMNIFPTIPDDDFSKRRGRPVKLKISRGVSRRIDTRRRVRGINMEGRPMRDEYQCNEADTDESDEDYTLSGDSDGDTSELNYEGLVNEDILDQETDVDGEDVQTEDYMEKHDESDLSDALLVNESEDFDQSDYEGEGDGLPRYKNKRRKWNDPFKGMYDNSFIDPGDGKITFEEGQTFDDVNMFRNALRDYAISGGFLFERVKNDPKRVTAICNGEECKWRIHASILQDGITFMVKTFDVHTCVRPTNNVNSNVRTKWVAEKVQQFLLRDTSASYNTMQATLTTVWGVEVPTWQLYKARNIVRDENESSHAEFYKREKIEDYVDNCFTVGVYLRTYDECIHPVPNSGVDIENPLQVILPPPLKRMAGRPKIARRRQVGEEAASNIRKQVKTVRCSNCKMLGHNSCERNPNDLRGPRQTAENMRSVRRGRGKGRGQSVATDAMESSEPVQRS